MAKKHVLVKHHSDSPTVNTMTSQPIDLLNHITTQLSSVSEELAAIKLQDSHRVEQISQAHDTLVRTVDALFSKIEEPNLLQRRSLKLASRTINVAKINVALAADDLSGHNKSIRKPHKNVLKFENLPLVPTASNLSSIWGPPSLPGPETGAIPKASTSKLNAHATPFPQPQENANRRLVSVVNGLGLSPEEVSKDPQLQRDLSYSMMATTPMQCEATKVHELEDSPEEAACPRTPGH